MSCVAGKGVVRGYATSGTLIDASLCLHVRRVGWRHPSRSAAVGSRKRADEHQQPCALLDGVLVVVTAFGAGMASASGEFCCRAHQASLTTAPGCLIKRRSACKSRSTLPDVGDDDDTMMMSTSAATGHCADRSGA